MVIWFLLVFLKRLFVMILRILDRTIGHCDTEEVWQPHQEGWSCYNPKKVHAHTIVWQRKHKTWFLGEHVLHVRNRLCGKKNVRFVKKYLSNLWIILLYFAHSRIIWSSVHFAECDDDVWLGILVISIHFCLSGPLIL